MEGEALLPGECPPLGVTIQNQENEYEPRGAAPVLGTGSAEFDPPVLDAAAFPGGVTATQHPLKVKILGPNPSWGAFRYESRGATRRSGRRGAGSNSPVSDQEHLYLLLSLNSERRFACLTLGKPR